MLNVEYLDKLVILWLVLLLGIYAVSKVLLDELITVLAKLAFTKNVTEERKGIKKVIRFIAFIIAMIVTGMVESVLGTIVKAAEERIYSENSEYIIDGEVKDVQYYIFMSQNEEIPIEELQNLDTDMLFYIRNGIFAYHGRRFTEDYMTDYYNKYEWYDPYIDPGGFDCSVFSETEWNTIRAIQEVEEQKKD